MHVKLVRIGNSRGVRFPKTVIERARLQDDLDLDVRGGAVVIRPVRRLRSGWADAAQLCRESDRDDLSAWDTTTNDGDWA